MPKDKNFHMRCSIDVLENIDFIHDYYLRFIGVDMSDTEIVCRAIYAIAEEIKKERGNFAGGKNRAIKFF